MSRILTALLLAAALPTCLWARDAEKIPFPNDLSKWIVTAPPAPASDRLSAANHSRAEWVVSLSHDRVAVALRDFKPTESPLPFKLGEGRREEGWAGEQFMEKVDDGWIVGLNAGENGASLWWFAPSGKPRYKISDDQIWGFIHSTAGLLALEGLGHLASSRGQIIRLMRGEDRRWKSSRFVDLGHAPETSFQERDGSILVATSNRLLRVHLNKKIDVLLSDTSFGGLFWRSLYPNSIIRDSSGVIYLGMRHGVARITRQKKSYSVEWLLPNKNFVKATRKA